MTLRSKMLKSKVQSKSRSKMLKDLSKENLAFGSPELNYAGDDVFDNLQRVQSNLFSLFREINEHLQQAGKHSGPSNQCRKEIESYTTALNNVITNLKPWLIKFQKSYSTVSMEPKEQQRLNSRGEEPVCSNEKSGHIMLEHLENMDSLISPSPLVSWKAGCTLERGRQLFLLTPLSTPKYRLPSPKTSTAKPASTIVAPSLATISENHGCMDFQATKTTPPSGPHSSVSDQESSLCRKNDYSALFVTPRFKMSPPKSVALLEETRDLDVSCDDGYVFRDADLLELQKAPARSVQNLEDLVASPVWAFSPPKTYAVVDQSDDTASLGSKVVFPAKVQSRSGAQKRGTDAALKETNVSHNLEGPTKTCLVVEGTPMWKENGSKMSRAKNAGENTLRRELWMKFESVSTVTNRLDVSVNGKERFIQRLDEASLG